MENAYTNSMNKINTQENSPIKQILYNYIYQNESRIQKLILNDSESIFTKIIESCYKDVININGDVNKNLGDFIEGALHYLLTLSMTPSQRKIAYNGIEIDIVIPSIKVLSQNPRDSLVIYIPKTNNISVIKSYLNSANKIQPINNNLWIISNEILLHDCKQYVINTSHKNSVTYILENIKYFISHKKINKFKIIGI